VGAARHAHVPCCVTPHRAAQVSRVARVSPEGAELAWLRREAAARGPAFLRAVDPYIGAVVCGRPEWEYVSEVRVRGARPLHTAGRAVRLRTCIRFQRIIG
jgi:hypothetical protein